ncbi:uncharacterized protein TrAtP1_002319 [Trichoderma atroviride]|uniref:uncharacterized protein n=1 Tax=Hypocrea atroviridis TaxID=63577 RepID=UPI00332A0B64|nr:hypothetical protein TrAtP1_002319 [Trichoderma atroviride]
MCGAGSWWKRDLSKGFTGADGWFEITHQPSAPETVPALDSSNGVLLEIFSPNKLASQPPSTSSIHSSKMVISDIILLQHDWQTQFVLPPMFGNIHSL